MPRISLWVMQSTRVWMARRKWRLLLSGPLTGTGLLARLDAGFVAGA